MTVIAEVGIFVDIASFVIVIVTLEVIVNYFDSHSHSNNHNCYERDLEQSTHTKRHSKLKAGMMYQSCITPSSAHDTNSVPVELHVASFTHRAWPVNERI